MKLLSALLALLLSGLQPSLKALATDRLFLDPAGGESDEHSGDVADVTLANESSLEPSTITVSTLCTETTGSALQDSTSDTWEEIHPNAGTTVFPLMSTPWPVEVTPVPEDQVAAGIAAESHEQENTSEEGDDEEGACPKSVSPEAMRNLSEAMMKFSIDLFRQVDLESKKPNVILSPFSIALSLAQLALGAGNQTERKLLETLHMGSVKCLHSTLKSVRKQLTKTILSIAARIYTKKGFQVKESFLKSLESFYGAKPVNLAGKGEEDLIAINKWVKEVTGGKIPKFLSHLPEDLVLLLLTAVHFKGLWRNKFDPSFTTQDKFHVSEQEVVTVEMMKAPKYPLSWFTLPNLEAQVARFPFKGNLSFVVVVPNKFEWDFFSVLQSLNQTDLFFRFPKASSTLVKVPKLVLDYQLELNAVLTRMGLGELFTHPDLSRISNESLLVSSIQHQTTLELNEDGVEASAVTGVVMYRSVSTFSLNQPFIFFLLDDTTRLPLYLGKVRNPNPSSSTKRNEQKDSPHLNHFMKSLDPK
ncbi:alpha-2-antiplasmin [Rhinatrema bivittatum]|uniref:alpha-2-antiplasmin n=1 Tax=Rhinatrema bivittatum TaxID=194408 RepID=UPI0011288A51|nr:alpha-2-antiplasmin [Rhinatrema bivittatum]